MDFKRRIRHLFELLDFSGDSLVFANPVGAGLPAMAACQSKRVFECTGLIAGKPAPTGNV
jgi:hypothetical protein